MLQQLADRKCKPCEGGVAPLTLDEARAMQSSIDPAWTLTDHGRSIQRDFKFKVFSRTIAFVNAVAFVSTTEGHHPAVTFSYGDCRISYRTTAIDGLSENDFICAAKVDRLAAEL